MGDTIHEQRLPTMKTILVSLIVLAGIASAAHAKTCRTGAYDVCAYDGYQIVEVEPNTYWPHNQMESAHIMARPKVRYRRVRVRRHLFRCAR